MNALHLPYLATDRVAEYRRQADRAQIAAAWVAAAATHDAEPRIPRRGPLQVFGGLRSILRSVFA